MNYPYDEMVSLRERMYPSQQCSKSAQTKIWPPKVYQSAITPFPWEK